jgi:hypothetical protein
MRKVKMTLQEEISAIKRMNKKLLNENYEESYNMDEELSDIDMNEFGEETSMDEMGDYSEELPMDEMDEMGEYDEFSEDALG